MKKIIAALVLCIVSTLCFGQEKIGTYHSNYFDKDFYVEYSEKTGNYYIQIAGETATKHCCFIVKDIDNFRTSLSDAKDKYAEWIKVAKENNVKTMDKDMDIKFSKGTFAWCGREWYFNFYAVPKPRFLITSTGDYLFLLFSGKEFSASDNQYITEKAYWAFSSVSEIEELLNLISQETLQRFLDSKAAKDDLFK